MAGIHQLASPRFARSCSSWPETHGVTAAVCTSPRGVAPGAAFAYALRRDVAQTDGCLADSGRGLCRPHIRARRSARDRRQGRHLWLEAGSAAWVRAGPCHCWRRVGFAIASTQPGDFRGRLGALPHRVRDQPSVVPADQGQSSMCSSTALLWSSTCSWLGVTWMDRPDELDVFRCRLEHRGGPQRFPSGRFRSSKRNPALGRGRFQMECIRLNAASPLIERAAGQPGACLGLGSCTGSPCARPRRSSESKELGPGQPVRESGVNG